jgi:hypothetical protein
MRINGFEQIKALYSIVFSQEYDFTPQHISLYVFFINQNNRNNWVEWFKCPYDLAMAGACIGSKKTYYKCLNDLQEWKLLEYEKGSNNWKAPKIKLKVLKCTSNDTSSVPQSEPLPTPLPTQAVEPLPTHIYKPITNNLKPKEEIREAEPKHNMILWLEKNCTTVMKMKEPITNEQALKLYSDYPTKLKGLQETFLSMENKPDLLKKYKSANLTVRNWMKNYKEPEVPQVSKYKFPV